MLEALPHGTRRGNACRILAPYTGTRSRSNGYPQLVFRRQSWLRRHRTPAGTININEAPRDDLLSLEHVGRG